MTTESAGLSIEEAAAKLIEAEDSYESEIPDELIESEADTDEVEAQADADDAEADESEDEEVDDADTDEASDSPGPTYKVKVNGEEIEVTLEELTGGYQKHSDYIRKTESLANERKAFQAEAEQVRATRDQYAEGLKNLEAALAKMAPPEPDWDRLRKEDPAEFAASWAEHQRLKEATSQVAAEREKIEREQREESEKQFADFLEGQRTKLLEAIPEWQDNEKASAEKGALMEYARGLGYTDEELGQVYDHRLLLVLRDAKRYRDLTTKSAALVADKKVVTKVLQPGSPSAPKPKGKQAEISKLRQELARSGSPKAAARLFELLEE